MTFPRASLPVWAISATLLLAILLPYIYASQAAGSEHVFGGFLLNPQDGNSYLAKMYQGWSGSWKFTLTYSAQAGEGAYLFLFYLALGHLARWMNAPLILVFHVARLLAACFMLWALYRFCRSFLAEPPQRWLAFGLAALGSGLGWLTLPFGTLTADFWVAEGYPFLSAYANPHFPLSLGILLWILTPLAATDGWAPSYSWLKRMLGEWHIGLLALLMALLSPFAVVLALVVLASILIVTALSRRADGRASQYGARLAWVALGGLPVLLYDQLAMLRDASLRAWNAQNVTPAPALWDVAVSFSPLLWLAILGAVSLWKSKRLAAATGSPDWRLPLVWAFLGMALLYLPFALQRRFLLGWYAPLAVLALPGLQRLASGSARRYRLLVSLLFVLVLPTNLLVILAARGAVRSHDAQLYLGRQEAVALEWLASHASPGAVVLASPRTGMFIPAHSGLRVVYGHPFETVAAQAQRQRVLDFFSNAGDMDMQRALVDQNQVAFIFFGPSEQALGSPAYLDGLQPVFQSSAVNIYSPREEPSACARWISRGQVR